MSDARYQNFFSMQNSPQKTGDCSSSFFAVVRSRFSRVVCRECILLKQSKTSATLENDQGTRTEKAPRGRRSLGDCSVMAIRPAICAYLSASQDGHNTSPAQNSRAVALNPTYSDRSTLGPAGHADVVAPKEEDRQETLRAVGYVGDYVQGPRGAVPSLFLEASYIVASLTGQTG